MAFSFTCTREEGNDKVRFADDVNRGLYEASGGKEGDGEEGGGAQGRGREKDSEEGRA